MTNDERLLMRRAHTLIASMVRDIGPHLASIDFAELNSVLRDLNESCAAPSDGAK
jgi:hypothetical protein